MATRLCGPSARIREKSTERRRPGEWCARFHAAQASARRPDHGPVELTCPGGHVVMVGAEPRVSGGVSGEEAVGRQRLPGPGAGEILLS